MVLSRTRFGPLRRRVSTLKSAATCGEVSIIWKIEKKRLCHRRQAESQGEMGTPMSIQERNRVCGWSVAVIMILTAPAWAQVTSREYAYALKATGIVKEDGHGAPLLPSLSEVAQVRTVASAIGPKSGTVPDPSISAVNDLPTHDKIVGQDLSPCGSSKDLVQVVSAPSPAEQTPPTTMTVKTAALLELHSMRQSAVDLCLQLPTKYRTQLPECADIFRHEIRLKALAKEHQR